MKKSIVGILAISLALSATAQTQSNKISVDNVVGHYRFESGQVISLEAFGENLTAKSRGTPQNVLTLTGDGRFLYASTSAFLTFGLDQKGVVNTLRYHFEDRTDLATRIDDSEFEAQNGAWDLKIKNQTHSPECGYAVKRLVDEIRAGEPNYSKLSPMLARATRAQLPMLQPRFAAAGSEEVKFKSVDPDGNEIFDVTFANGSVTTWRVLCLSDGYLGNAAFRF